MQRRVMNVGITLTLSQTSPGFFYVSQYKSFENTVGKGEIARNEQFLLFPQCFLAFWRTFCHFHQICRQQTLSVWKSLKFVVWERVKNVSILYFALRNFLYILRKGPDHNQTADICPVMLARNLLSYINC